MRRVARLHQVQLYVQRMQANKRARLSGQASEVATLPGEAPIFHLTLNQNTEVL
jgi:hypothetical protein